jgi:hypothetical protein
MFVAIVLTGVGIAMAGAATISTLLYGGANPQMADIARQVQTLGDLQRHINDRLADLHAAAPVQQASNAPIAPPQRSTAVPPVLSPLKTIPVRVLPAEAAAPQPTPATANSPLAAAAPLPRTEAPAASFAPAATYLAYPPPPPPADYAPRVAYNDTVTPYHPRARHYYRAVVLPRPVAYLFGTVRRDVRILLR